ncbi:MAG: ABC transporter ATP-binding protein, partial [Clostridiales bacterium]|nr:ABC transporter ATP-binding protein [Clostridiales bacterium]
MRMVLQYLRPKYAAMAGGFCIKFTGTVMDLAIPWILSYILDNVIPLRDRGLIWIWGGIMVLCSLLALGGNVLANRLAAKVARDATERIRHDVFVRITRLSARQTDEITIPSLISRLSSDSYNVHQMIGMAQRLGVRAPILLIGGIIVTLSLDLYLTLVL